MGRRWAGAGQKLGGSWAGAGRELAGAGRELGGSIGEATQPQTHIGCIWLLLAC